MIDQERSVPTQFDRDMREFLVWLRDTIQGFKHYSEVVGIGSWLLAMNIPRIVQSMFPEFIDLAGAIATADHFLEMVLSPQNHEPSVLGVVFLFVLITNIMGVIQTKQRDKRVEIYLRGFYTHNEPYRKKYDRRQKDLQPSKHARILSVADFIVGLGAKTFGITGIMVGLLSFDELLTENLADYSRQIALMAILTPLITIAPSLIMLQIKEFMAKYNVQYEPSKLDFKR